MDFAQAKKFFTKSAVEKFFNSLSRDYYLREKRTDDGIDPHVVAFCDPDSYLAEQYKVLCTKLMGKTADQSGCSSIVITSAQPGDGKTVTASNLAATLAKNFKQRVLLIDADLRRPAVHSFFGIPRSPGLTDILKGSIGHQQFIEDPAVRNLYIIPAGSETSNPGGLLNSIGVKVLLSRISSKFDTIIFDTSPVLKTADAQTLGTHCDKVLFIVKAGVTPRHMIDEAFSLLRDTPGMPTACIMTNTHRVPDYYSYWTNPHYRQYYQYRANEQHQI